MIDTVSRPIVVIFKLLRFFLWKLLYFNFISDGQHPVLSRSSIICQKKNMSEWTCFGVTREVLRTIKLLSTFWFIEAEEKTKIEMGIHSDFLKGWVFLEHYRVFLMEYHIEFCMSCSFECLENKHYRDISVSSYQS